MQAHPQSDSSSGARRYWTLPRTRRGRLGVVLFGLHIALMVFFQLLLATGQRGGETFFDNVWLASTILLAGVAALAAGGVSLLAMIGRGERSLLSLLVAAYGMFVALFALGEVLAPH